MYKNRKLAFVYSFASLFYLLLSKKQLKLPVQINNYHFRLLYFTIYVNR